MWTLFLREHSDSLSKDPFYPVWELCVLGLEGVEEHNEPAGSQRTNSGEWKVCWLSLMCFVASMHLILIFHCGNDFLIAQQMNIGFSMGEETGEKNRKRKIFRLERFGVLLVTVDLQSVFLFLWTYFLCSLVCLKAESLEEICRVN